MRKQISLLRKGFFLSQQQTIKTTNKNMDCYDYQILGLVLMSIDWLNKNSLGK